MKKLLCILTALLTFSLLFSACTNDKSSDDNGNIENRETQLQETEPEPEENEPKPSPEPAPEPKPEKPRPFVRGGKFKGIIFGVLIPETEDDGNNPEPNIYTPNSGRTETRTPRVKVGNGK